MGQYAIIDTGYANTSNSGTQETMANSGNAITFNSAKLTYARNVSIDETPNPSRYEDSELNYVTQNNSQLVLTGVVARDEAAYETLLLNLDTLCTTKGLKLLYYSDSTDGYKNVPSALGSITHGSLQVDGTIKSLLIRVKNFSIAEDSAKNLARYTLTITVTKEVGLN